MRRKPPSSRPAINLLGPDAMQPALSDYTRLLDTFLAGRNPRTLAAYQADLEDYRRFMEAIMEAIPWDVPTAGDAVRLLLGGSERLANSEADRYRSKMISAGCRSRRSTAASPPCGR